MILCIALHRAGYDMIDKNLALRLFESSYLQRWNDKIRPVELAELYGEIGKENW